MPYPQGQVPEDIFSGITPEPVDPHAIDRQEAGALGPDPLEKTAREGVRMPDSLEWDTGRQQTPQPDPAEETIREPAGPVDLTPPADVTPVEAEAPVEWDTGRTATAPVEQVEWDTGRQSAAPVDVIPPADVAPVEASEPVEWDTGRQAADVPEAPLVSDPQTVSPVDPAEETIREPAGPVDVVQPPAVAPVDGPLAPEPPPATPVEASEPAEWDTGRRPVETEAPGEWDTSRNTAAPVDPIEWVSRADPQPILPPITVEPVPLSIDSSRLRMREGPKLHEPYWMS